MGNTKRDSLPKGGFPAERGSFRIELNPSTKRSVLSMPQNRPAFFSWMEKTDPRMSEEIANVFDLAMAPGELDARTKVMIAMCLDALAGAAMGVKSLAKTARGMGATEGQIAEALRLVYLVAGNKTLEAMRAAYEE